MLNEEYAIQIARDWNAAHNGAGYVTRFRVNVESGSSIHQELWVPAEELADFNRQIIGPIEVIASFTASDVC